MKFSNGFTLILDSRSFISEPQTREIRANRNVGYSLK